MNLSLLIGVLVLFSIKSDNIGYHRPSTCLARNQSCQLNLMLESTSNDSQGATHKAEPKASVVLLPINDIPKKIDSLSYWTVSLSWSVMVVSLLPLYFEEPITEYITRPLGPQIIARLDSVASFLYQLRLNHAAILRGTLFYYNAEAHFHNHLREVFPTMVEVAIPSLCVSSYFFFRAMGKSVLNSELAGLFAIMVSLGPMIFALYQFCEQYIQSEAERGRGILILLSRPYMPDSYGKRCFVQLVNLISVLKSQYQAYVVAS